MSARFSHRAPGAGTGAGRSGRGRGAAGGCRESPAGRRSLRAPGPSAIHTETRSGASNDQYRMSWCHAVSLLKPEMLGHDAVVVALGHFDPPLAHDAAQRRPELGRGGPAAEDRPARVRVQEPPRRICLRPRPGSRASPDSPRPSRTPPAPATDRRAPQHRLAHLFDARAIDEPADHQVAVTFERVRRKLVHRIDHGPLSNLKRMHRTHGTGSLRRLTAPTIPSRPCFREFARRPSIRSWLLEHPPRPRHGPPWRDLSHGNRTGTMHAPIGEPP